MRAPWPGTASRATRPALAAAGVLIVVVCAAIGASVAGRSGHGSPYLEVVRAVPAGTPLDQADLSVVDLDPSSGLAGLPAADEGSVLGQRATTPLAPGSLLVSGDLTVSTPVPRGDAVVGASLAPDQLPTELRPGDAVLVVLTDTAGPAGGAGVPATAAGSGSRISPGAAEPGTVLATGVVVDVGAPGTTSAATSSVSDATVVSLAVPAAVAPEVTAASAADQLSLALVPAPASRGER